MFAFVCLFSSLVTGLSHRQCSVTMVSSSVLVAPEISGPCQLLQLRTMCKSSNSPLDLGY